MTLVSLTAAGAFQAVGSVLVVAFMIGPPITAYLITDKLEKMLGGSVVFACINSLTGYYLASILDISIAGSMAVMTGVTFVLVFGFAPRCGLLTTLRRHKRQELDFAKKILLFHLYNHEGTAIEKVENAVKSIPIHLRWNKSFAEKIINSLKKDAYIYTENGVLMLTQEGRKASVDEYLELFCGEK